MIPASELLLNTHTEVPFHHNSNYPVWAKSEGIQNCEENNVKGFTNPFFILFKKIKK